MNINLRLLKLLDLLEDTDETNPISTKRLSTHVHGDIRTIQRSIKKSPSVEPRGIDKHFTFSEKTNIIKKPTVLKIQ